jgi:hypothetical protein
MYNDDYRHIHHKYNTIKYFLLNSIIFINYVKSKKNIANLLIKGLSKELVYDSLKIMGLKPLKIK